MVRNASRALKIGVHLPFDPNFDVGIGAFYPEKFWQAYSIGHRQKQLTQSSIMRLLKTHSFYTDCEKSTE